jgi:hypothetical protein
MLTETMTRSGKGGREEGRRKLGGRRGLEKENSGGGGGTEDRATLQRTNTGGARQWGGAGTEGRVTG